MTDIGQVPNRPIGTDNRSIATILADFDFITNWINGNNIDDSNIAPGGIGTPSLADGSITLPKLASGAISGWTDLASRAVLDVGLVNNTRAGRKLLLADWTTLLSISAPLGLWNLDTVNDSSGNARNLTNKGPSTTLNGSQTLPLASILVASTTGFAAQGQVLVGGQLVTYTSVDATHFLGATGGVGTIANGSPVTQLVDFVTGVVGDAGGAARFRGLTTQGLYIADTGAADPFRIKTGSAGGWSRTAKRGVEQEIVGKWLVTSQRGWMIGVASTNVAFAAFSLDGTTNSVAIGVTDICDDRPHWISGTFDGSVIRVYVDGQLEGSVALAGSIFGSSAPLNIGGYGADGATAATSPHFGRIDEAFVTDQVLDEAQIRLLMAAKIPHGASVAPKHVNVNVRKAKKGGDWETADFTATPKHNYPGGSLVDGGSLGNNLTANGAPVLGVGPDGRQNGAYIFKSASSQYQSATDAGLPAGTAPRTIVAWVKATVSGDYYIINYGTTTTAQRVGLQFTTGGVLRLSDGTNVIDSPSAYNDGQWHHVVGTMTNAADDGIKSKLYVDGRVVANSTTMVGSGVVLAGANAFRIGCRVDGVQFLDGSIGPVAITDYAMDAAEIASLYAEQSQQLLIAPMLDDADPRQCVQAIDATNIYFLGDIRKKISGRVNADGSIASAIGGDFRVVKGATGNWTIYFPPGYFTSPPTVTLTPGLAGSPSSIQASHLLETANQIAVLISQPGVGSYDLPFSFTAEGRGPIPSQHNVDISVL